ncbi:TniB family NTP-binding protein [Phyllobacterium sp. LjRoot231]|uniref:TniB family NTP-binding protein n=1 Tax=Phyllobacterium sp. LjRoot231 TaxID=3342289 RepID=UPI003ECC2C84
MTLDIHKTSASARVLPWTLSEEDAGVVQRLRQIHNAHCTNGNIRRVDHELEKLLKRVAATCRTNIDPPDIPPNEKEGYAMVITAPSFAGKSHCLNRIAKDPRLKPYMLDGVQRLPLLRIEAPSPCVLRTLGLEIFRTLNPAATKVPEKVHLIWHAVRQLLIAHSVLVMQINEFHNVMIGRTQTEIEELVTALKSVMVGTTIVQPPDGEDDRTRRLVDDQGELYPVFLILAGTPSTKEVTNNRTTEHFVQFSRRCVGVDFREIPARRDEEGRPKFVGMPEFLSTAQKEMGLETDPRLETIDMQKRFYKASAKHFGRVMCLLKTAAEEAALAGKGHAPYEHLANAFERLYQTGDAGNCFLVADIDRCPAPPDPRSLRLVAQARGEQR